MKHATTTAKTKDVKVKVELETISTADVKASATLPQRYRWRDELSILFEPHHVRWTHSHLL